MTDAPRVLDLSKIFDRPTVKLGDEEYELRNRDEFTLVEHTNLEKLVQRAEELRASGDESDKALVEAAKIMQDLVKLVTVNLDREVPEFACLAIFTFWAEQQPGGLFETADPPNRASRRAAKRTTGGSSRVSNRSTAAARKTGSTKSQAGR